MNIDKLVNEVIPPADYSHRNGFNNIPIIKGLTETEKQLLENRFVGKETPYMSMSRYKYQSLV
jgi:hypothetical protein